MILTYIFVPNILSNHHEGMKWGANTRSVCPKSRQFNDKLKVLRFFIVNSLR